MHKIANRDVFLCNAENELIVASLREAQKVITKKREIESANALTVSAERRLCKKKR